MAGLDDNITVIDHENGQYTVITKKPHIEAEYEKQDKKILCNNLIVKDSFYTVGTLTNLLDRIKCILRSL